MILYHTSTIEVKEPCIRFSRTFLDFGKGFYTTPSKVQAKKYAKRFFKESLPAVLNTFELDENLDSISWHTFEAYDGDWLDYVVACRRNQEHDLYDVVEGGIADDDVFNTLDLYMAVLIEREEAIKRLKKKKPNWQICFCNQQLINKHLHFIESQQLQLTEE